MIINSGNMEPKLVKDYDFIFTNGLVHQVTIDESLGDSIEIGEDLSKVHIGARPSQGDPTQLSPEEDNTINMKNVIMVVHRKRTIIPQSPEQKEQFHQLIKQRTSKTIH